MPRRFVIGTGWLVMLLVAEGASGATLGETVYVGGFVSQGYVNSSRHNYLMPNTREGSGEFNEAAFNLSAQPLDDLRVGAQFLGRDFGSRIDATVTVDWAYGDWRWRDELGVRAGKIKLPYGLYNQGRDIDMLRTPVLLPQSIYAEADRDLIIAYEGVGFYGNIPCGGWGELDYELSYGSLSVPESGIGPTNEEVERNARDLEGAVAAEVATQYGVPADDVAATVAGDIAVDLQVPWIAGGSLIWTTPLTGLRIGGSAFAGDIEAAGTVHYDVLVDDGQDVPAYLPYAISFDDDLDLHSVFTTSLEYSRGAWLLAAELTRTRFASQRDLGWYVSGRYRLDRRWSVAAVYSEYYPDYDDRDGEALVRAGEPAHGAWQDDLGVSVRFDVNDHWLLKLEYHAMDGTALTLPGGPDAATSEARHWRVIAAKTTFHF
jgi:hypothetical protein